MLKCSLALIFCVALTYSSATETLQGEAVKLSIPALSSTPRAMSPVSLRPIFQPTQTITIAAVGDILLHGALQRQAAARPDGYTSLWRETLPWLQGADITYANLEGPVAAGLLRSGREVKDPGATFDNQVYTSYPMFNYPATLLSGLVDSGVDIVSTSNNHSLDRGSRGADLTIEALEHAGLPYMGTRRSSSDKTDLDVWIAHTYTRGVKLAWVACSYDTNGIPDKHHQVLNCYRDREILLSVVQRASNDASVSGVIVAPHWGNEYQSKPSAQEKTLAQELVDAGALLIIGAHPHVPQPWETLYNTETGEAALVVYSLGNFVSGQFHRLHTRASLILSATIEAQPGGKARLVSARYTPLEMRRTGDGLAVEPILDGRGTPAIVAHLKDQFGDWDSGLTFD